MIEILQVAKEFAKEDHTEFDSFIFIIISHGVRSYINGTDGGTVSLEQVMSEYTATKCPTLQGKPKLFFVQRFTMVTSKRSRVTVRSTQAQCSTETDAEMQPAFPLVVTGGCNCPEGADFLLACVNSAVDKAKPGQKDLFFQVRFFIKVVNGHGFFAANDHMVKLSVL